MPRARSILERACEPEHLSLAAAAAIVAAFLLLVWILPAAAI